MENDAKTTRIMNINCVNNTVEMDDVPQEVKMLIEEYLYSLKYEENQRIDINYANR